VNTEQEVWYMKTELVKFGSYNISKDSPKVVIQNTASGIIIWSGSNDRKDDFDDQLSLVIPTLLCKDINGLVRCYTESQSCESVAQNIGDANFTIQAAGYVYYVRPSSLLIQDGSRCNIDIAMGV
jgi:hypothetical protein